MPCTSHAISKQLTFSDTKNSELIPRHLMLEKIIHFPSRTSFCLMNEKCWNNQSQNHSLIKLMKVNEICQIRTKSFINFCSIQRHFAHNLGILLKPVNSQLILQNFIYRHNISYRSSFNICSKWVGGEKKTENRTYLSTKMFLVYFIHFYRLKPYFHW